MTTGVPAATTSPGSALVSRIDLGAAVALGALESVVEDGEDLARLHALPAMDQDASDPPRQLESQLPFVQLDDALERARLLPALAGEERAQGHRQEASALVYHTT